MAEVIRTKRKSTVLTPSSLAFLAHVPTVNLTAGCAHECRYCYARGYLTHPGEGKVAFYTNTLVIAASVLFLRPAVIGSLRRHMKDTLMLKPLLDRFIGSERLAIHAGNSRVAALPASVRLEIMERLKSIAHCYGLQVLVCACKNPDISSGSCHISGRWPPAVSGDSQLQLFQL